MGLSLFHVVMTACMFRESFNVRVETEACLFVGYTEEAAQEEGQRMIEQRWATTDGWESHRVYVREFNVPEMDMLRGFFGENKNIPGEVPPERIM